MKTKPKVLIVDDEEDLTWTLNKKFSKDKDKFEVLVASNGREALEVLGQVPVKVVVSDIRMPEINGLDLLLQIKKHYPETKVIIMTAYGSPEIRSQALKQGCMYYVEKPFEINELRSLILEAVSEKKGFAGTVSDFQLSDIIQLNCLGNLTTALYVKHDKDEGIIYFKEGNIIHAEVGSRLEGESAFYEIVSWQGGEFSVKRNAKPAKESISRSWQNLLLEGLRLADENSSQKEDHKEKEKAQKIVLIQNELGKLIRLNGVLGVLLLTEGGFQITSVVHEKKWDLSNDELASSFDEVLSKYKEFAQSIGASRFQMNLTELDNYQLFMITLPEKTDYILVISEPKVNIGLLRLELRKTIEKLLKYF